MWAADGGLLKVVGWLLEAGADTGIVAGNGRTAAIAAEINGHQTILRLLHQMDR